ncbi:MAG: endo-1,4-beta-xylanase [Clostridia bacterium]|nr:endo-1,4-beta-xylanase [Clostridia bacterium]
MERKDYLLQAYHQNQSEIDARVREGIETYRKGNATLRVQDKDGKPLAASVRVRLKNHAFRFGANCFMLDEMESAEKNEHYKEKFAEVFNLATLPFYWKDLEPQPGNLRFAADSEKIYRRPAPDLCLAYCRQHGIEPKAHCLNYMQWSPDWLPDDIDETKRLLEKRFAELADRYSDEIPNWEVINETLCGCARKFFYDPEIVEWSFATARRYFPDNELTINEATDPARFVWHNHYIGNRIPYYMQIERALRKGATIDSIGLQYHLFYRREGEAEASRMLLDPTFLYKIHDLYADFNLPMQITEVTVPAYSREAQDEELQAEAISMLYRVWFSMEKMEKVIYWNLQDGYAAFAPQGDMTAGENYYHGALLRFDGSEKPAYKCLCHLIKEEWQTDEHGECGEQAFAFRGYYGDYEATITVDGTTHTLPFTLKKGAENKIVLTL